MATKGTNDREDQDTLRPKAAAWETMSQYYNSEEETLSVISPSVIHKLAGLNIPEGVACNFDKLTADKM